MVGFVGANGQVSAAAIDGSGNLYIGGGFTAVGETIANCIAKWDGSRWTALGSGMNGGVSALAVSGNNLYAGGGFTIAGGIVANAIAKWDGSNWTALGSG
jgi:trimeric autotransporter adhesin